MALERKVPLLHRTGLHLRAAGRFSQTAGKYAADIRLTVTGRTVNAKSVLDILTLAAGPGVEMLIAAEGADAESALDDLVSLVQRNFDEEP